MTFLGQTASSCVSHKFYGAAGRVTYPNGGVSTLLCKFLFPCSSLPACSSFGSLKLLSICMVLGLSTPPCKNGDFLDQAVQMRLRRKRICTRTQNTQPRSDNPRVNKRPRTNEVRKRRMKNAGHQSYYKAHATRVRNCEGICYSYPCCSSHPSGEGQVLYVDRPAVLTVTPSPEGSLSPEDLFRSSGCGVTCFSGVALLLLSY